MEKDNSEQSFIPSNMATIDWDNCLLLANHKEDLAKTILNMFIVSLPEALDIINNHYKQQAWKPLADELHKLLGGCSYAGTPRLKYITKEAEKALREQQQAKIPSLIDILNKEAVAVLDSYKDNSLYHIYLTTTD